MNLEKFFIFILLLYLFVFVPWLAVKWNVWSNLSTIDSDTSPQHAFAFADGQEVKVDQKTLAEGGAKTHDIASHLRGKEDRSLRLRQDRIDLAKKLHVIVIANQGTQQFPLIGYGGIEAAVETVADELHRTGIKFKVITPKIAIPPQIPFEFEILQTPHNAGIGIPTFMANVKKILVGLNPQPDVIWSQSNWSGKYLHDLGIPMIVTHHDSGEGINLPVSRYPNVINRFISQSQMEAWAKHKPWIHEGTDAFMLWYGFRRDEFQLKLDKTPKTALFVGRLNEKKGFDKYLHLAKSNPDWIFYVYGPTTDRIHQRLPSNVRHMGELKRGEMHHRAFSEASRFFMFVKWKEGFGRVVLEAMTKGTPVLASNVGSLPELIRGPDGNGDGLVGTISETIEQLNTSLHKDYNYEEVYEYARKNFAADREIEALLLKSLELVETVRGHGHK